MWVGWAGVVFAALGLIAVIRSVATGVVPARWPMPPLSRSVRPFEYWFSLTSYALCTVGGLALAFRFLS